MKKLLTLVLALVLSFTMMVGLTSCGGASLETREVCGLSLSVPDDLGEFVDTDGTMKAADDDSYGVILASDPADGGGVTADMYTQEVYEQAYCQNSTDVEFKSYDNHSKFEGNPAISFDYTCVNTNGIPVEQMGYIIFYEDGSVQAISINFALDQGCSVEQYAQEIFNSIAIAQ